LPILAVFSLLTWETSLVDSLELFEITCPRCNSAAQVRFYGPCDECRGQLAASGNEAGREIAEVAYEPKMNVVPNQIATKE
jgi:RecJ-like exonuclease